MKNVVKQILLNIRMVWLVDLLRMGFRMLRYRGANVQFRRVHPDFIPPPPYIQFETTNSVDYDFFFRSGKRQAEFMAEVLLENTAAKPDKRVLDWGCGASKVLRHLPALLKERATLCGSDYNRKSISYGRSNFPEFRYTVNNLLPPLEFPDRYFDMVYSISVFTHLSLDNCRLWIAELERVLMPMGVLVFTTNGRGKSQDFLQSERLALEHQGYLERSSSLEGKKWFSSFHTPAFVENVLCSGWSLIRGEEESPVFYGQDVWVFRRKGSEGTP